MLARDVRVLEDAVAFLRAPEGRAGGVQDVAAVVHGHDGAGVHVGGVGAALGLRLLGLGRRVDHRVALLALRGLGALALRRADQAGLDPELAEAQAIVLVEADDGAGQKVVLVAASVLEQVSAQLLGQRGLVVLEAAVVVGGQPDRVFVRHVDPRHRGGLVGVHLLRELSRDLDRLHAGAEGAAEHAFDEALYACFKVA